MSLDALRWAFSQQGLRPLDKLVLLTLADRASADDTAWPSWASLVADTGANRKSIRPALGRLIEAGLIEDTGTRAGSTRRVIVWRLVGIPHRHNGPENGTIKGTEKQSQKGDDMDKETVPKTDGNSPKNGQKQSQKRYSEPIRTYTEPERAAARALEERALARLGDEPGAKTMLGCVRIAYDGYCTEPVVVVPNEYVAAQARNFEPWRDIIEGLDIVVGQPPDPETMVMMPDPDRV